MSSLLGFCFFQLSGSEMILINQWVWVRGLSRRVVNIALISLWLINHAAVGEDVRKCCSEVSFSVSIGSVFYLVWWSWSFVQLLPVDYVCLILYWYFFLLPEFVNQGRSCHPEVVGVWERFILRCVKIGGLNFCCRPCVLSFWSPKVIPSGFFCIGLNSIHVSL